MQLGRLETYQLDSDREYDAMVDSQGMLVLYTS